MYVKAPIKEKQAAAKSLNVVTDYTEFKIIIEMQRTSIIKGSHKNLVKSKEYNLFLKGCNESIAKQASGKKFHTGVTL